MAPPLSFSITEVAVIVLGALAGGFVNGLTGFGTALTAIPIWIQVLDPAAATALAAAAGVTGQLQTVHLIRKAVDWKTVGPFIVAGLIGIPVGIRVLPSLDPVMFKSAVGVIMIAYCSFTLVVRRWPAVLAVEAAAGRDRPSWGERLTGLAIGFAGGVMSGIAGLSAPLPIAWMTFKPWPRDRKRALLQAFNTAILAATLIGIVAAGLVTARFWAAFLVAVPGTLIGVKLGAVVYRRLDDRRFDNLVIGLLLFTGIALVAGNLAGALSSLSKP